MEVHTFRASSLQEALEQVRRTLGPDASVLQTREIKRGRLGLFSKKLVEVEASLALAVNSRFDPQPLPQPVKRVSAVTNTQPSPSGRQALTRPADAPPSEGRLPQAIADATDSAATTAPLTPVRQAGQGLVQALDVTQIEQHDIKQHELKQHAQRLPAALFETLSELLDAGVEPAEAKQLVQAAAQHCTPEQLQDSWLVKGRIVQLVAADLRVAEPLDVQPGKQQVVAFVGPTGVGKTTTLAKLATRFHLDQSCRVGFVTLDTFRPGAVDQLLQYAESLDAPLEVVSSADQFLPALQRLNACDLVLLDTAGRSPSDAEQISVLSHSLLAAQPTSVQLVVSATSSAGHIQAAFKQFAPLTPTGLVITKLDEAVGFGAWLSILRHSHLPISYLTHGQQVPQDIAVANRRRLASLLLGHANHHSASMLA